MKFTACIYSLLVFVSILSVSSCAKDDQMEIDEQRIQDFLLEHNLDADSTSSGLYYIIDEPGSAEHPTIEDVVTVSYVGFLLNGDIFDSGEITFPLTNVIAGWQEGIPLFGRGGKGLLIIPSHLAYGDVPKNGIPANSVLAFDIHLIDF
jgi:FKBP-type peptidyl-prolyl cis-trans isomerase FkpA